ncbi:hypothetical protein JO972_03035 [Verrucomicrobiaceae bacterium 5K15]|uniref:Uncharacterized protein n=1 Tax=Oceaniferula flava TaxID=2800421 RepID=A0AAE2VAZ9_9BACT|nr:hypothetical protein [Oceaniferula flavus]MBK1853920.1 hypothetical protein [Oceaniferula flavus]MBM1135226.1 hypothetical protein [Oceaniferula flavus]
MSDHIESILDAELLELEAQLAALVPCSLSVETTLRVEDAMHAAIEEKHDEELQSLESHLGQLAPAGMSADLVTRMAEAMDRWHEYVPLEEKLVPFGDHDEPLSEPAAETIVPMRRKSSSYGMYAAAAAVALLGAAAALVMPHMNQPAANAVIADAGSAADLAPTPKASPVIDSGNLHSVDVSTAPREAWVEPGSLSHDITNTIDAGVMITRDNVPHRSIRIEYVDRVKLIDEDGREIQIDRPGVQYMLIPVKTN